MCAIRQRPPQVMRLAAHPLRWRLMAELALSDLRVRELTRLVGQPQNLVSYHLRQLRDGGLVTAGRSSHDGRDSYYRLDLDRYASALADAGGAVHPAVRLEQGPPPVPSATMRPPRVLFACTGNSARSPIAEALLRRRAEGRADVVSAGSRPRSRLHPMAVRVLRDEYGVEVGDQRPRSLASLDGRRFDYVVTLCDKVREVCPEFGDERRRIHWSIADPAAGDPAGEPGYRAFRDAAAAIDGRVRHLLSQLAEPIPQEVRT